MSADDRARDTIHKAQKVAAISEPLRIVLDLMRAAYLERMVSTEPGLTEDHIMRARLLYLQLGEVLQTVEKLLKAGEYEQNLIIREEELEQIRRGTHQTYHAA